jgi:hypothetical protein
MTKKNKRELVLSIREAKRKAAKAERALAYENAKAFAAANPTPKLPQHIRIRPRDERQILKYEETGTLPVKTARRLGIIDQYWMPDPYQLNHWVKAITESQKIRSDRNQAFTLSWQLQVAKNNAPAESELELKVL